MINYFSHQQLSAAVVRKLLVEAVIDSDKGESGEGYACKTHAIKVCSQILELMSFFPLPPPQ